MTTAIIVVGSVVLLVGLFVLIMRHLFSGWVDQ